MARIRHTGPVGSILKARGGAKTPYIVSIDEYRYKNTGGSVTTLPHTLTVPGGWLTDDLVCVFTFAEYTLASIATADFRRVLTTASLDGVGDFAILRASGAGNSIVTNNVTVPGGDSIKLMACVVRGARGTDFYGSLAGTAAATKRTLTLPSRSARAAGLFLMFAANNIPTPGTITTPPAGMTVNQFSGLGLNMALASQEVAVGDDLSKSITFSNGGSGDQCGGLGVLLIG